MAMKTLLLSVYIVTFLMGVPANILAFCTFYCKVQRKPSPIDILLLNLTISDLIFLTFLPFKMKEALDDMVWSMPYFLCPVTGFLFYTTIYNSILLLTAVSVERYLGVAFPIRYSLWRRPRYAVWVSISCWVVSSMNLSIVYIVPCAQWIEDPTAADSASNTTAALPLAPTTCYLEFTEAQLSILVKVRLELFIILFCIPLLICCFCYFNFVRILSQLPNIGRRRRLRAIGLALGTLLVFAVCFGPYNASHVVGFARQESEKWRYIALLSSTVNACLDPIIFYFSSSAVRSVLSRCFRSLAAKLHILRCAPAPCRGQLGNSKAERYREGPKPVNI